MHTLSPQVTKLCWETSAQTSFTQGGLQPSQGLTLACSILIKSSLLLARGGGSLAAF